MEFLIKVIAPEALRQKDVLEDLRIGVTLVANEQMGSPYGQALGKVKLRKFTVRSPVKKLTKVIQRGGAE